MMSQPSSLTPLGFTREYQSYRAANSGVPFHDTRLLAAVRFWVRFPDALTSESYSSFWLEDLPPLLTADPAGFEDLHPDELAEIAVFLASLDPTKFTSALTTQSLWEVAARKWLCVGDAAKAVDALTRAGIAGPNSESELADITSDAQLLPRALLERLGSANDSMRSWLSRVDAEWQSLRETGHPNRATCVLVERDVAGRPIRGRLRTLEAHIEALPKGREADEVVFGHQLCTADDPQVRGAFAALAALRLAPSEVEGIAEYGLSRAKSSETRNAESEVDTSSPPRSTQTVMARSGATKPSALQPEHPILSLGTSKTPHSAIRNPQSHLRARFTFANGGSREPYGGDSLGFACLVTAFGDLWSKDLHRERRLVSAQVALTGALDTEGRVEAVSASTLPLKVERVFFSPLSFMVIPQANRQAAEAEAAGLQSLYPNRRLRILTAERATDLITDGNITIPERVCLGEYAVRAAVKYTRSVKVQVPLLILLCAILGWLAVPKLRAILDGHVTDIVQTVRGFRAINQYGRTLWEKVYPVDSLLTANPYVVTDVDNDGANEIFFWVCSGYDSPDNAKVDVFSADGTLRFRLDLAIPGQYPGDHETGEVYAPGFVKVLTVNGEPIIVTAANAQNPSRFHIKVWSAAGDAVGWYVNAGVTVECIAYDCDLDGNNELLLAGYNIRMRSTAVFAIPAIGSYGVSPPYADPQYDLSRVVVGNQLRYVIFPRTDLTTLFADRIYNALGAVKDVSNRGLRVDVLEGSGPDKNRSGHFWAVNYYLDSALYLKRVDVDDTYKARRESLVRSDSLPEIPWTEYFDQLRDTVMYWTENGWVNDRARRDGRHPR